MNVRALAVPGPLSTDQCDGPAAWYVQWRACMLLLGAHSGRKKRTYTHETSRYNGERTYHSNYKVGTCMMMMHLARLDAAVLLLINVHARRPRLQLLCVLPPYPCYSSIARRRDHGLVV